MNVALEKSLNNTRTACGKDGTTFGLSNGFGIHLFWECLLVLLIVGFMTLSHIEGWSRLMILYGIIFGWSFSIYFLYHKLRVQPEIIIYFIWILSCIGGGITAYDKAKFLTAFTTILQMGVLIFLVATIVSLRGNLSYAMFAIALGGIIVVLIAFYTGEFQRAAEVEADMRVEGLTGNANDFAYNVLLVLASLFYFFGYKPSFAPRLLLGAAVVGSLACVVLSGSRSGYSAFLLFIVLWFFFCQSKIIREKPLVVLGTLVVLIMTFYLSYDYVMSSTTLGVRFHYKDISRGFGIRSQMYKDGLDMIVKHPIYGVGLNNFRALSSSGLYSHSDYIEVASDTGLIGFVLYYSIYLVLWGRLKRIKCVVEESHALYVIGVLQAVILTILFFGFFMPQINIKLTWVFLASAIGYSWSVEKKLYSKL